MKTRATHAAIAICALAIAVLSVADCFSADSVHHEATFPPNLEDYQPADGIWAMLKSRVGEVPFNLVATIIFFLAVVHTFLTSKFMAISHRWAHAHEEKIKRGEVSRDSVHHGAELFHFLGEVEAVFGIWAIPLVMAISIYFDWGTAIHYIGQTVNFAEPAFVVVIMTLAATRPILKLSENIIKRIADIFGGSLAARWLTTLSVGPLLGSFITEPAAMTISALLLARMFFALEPSTKFKYGTLGLLLVNISVGGTLTHFAAPPVLMVASAWDWGTAHMLAHFGWKAAIGILISNGLYFLIFRREVLSLEEKFAVTRLKEEIQTRYLQRAKVDAEFDKLSKSFVAEKGIRESIDAQIKKLIDDIRAHLEEKYIPELLERGIDEERIREAFAQRFEEIRLREVRRIVPGLLPPSKRGVFLDPDWDTRDDPVPLWVTIIHVAFMGWTVLTAHYPPLFILGMLFFLGFAQVSKEYQNTVDLKPAMLVGFFLAGLVIHGGLQGWWIAPILANLGEIPLMAVGTVLTAFNDNAAITYLATLVPNFGDHLKYAIVAGAVAGGGLTIIANAPNPAGISLLKKYFNDAVSPLGLLAGAIVPTVIMFVLFLVTR
jgi:hypothetical protein